MNSRPLNKQDLTNEIKAEALRLGFFTCGIAKADSVEKATADHVKRWLKEGKQANMDYMANYMEKRLDPRLLMEGARSIICVALTLYFRRVSRINGVDSGIGPSSNVR